VTTAVPAPPALERTPLYEFHRRHGAHFVPFAGWEMPLYYSSILAEHRAVRGAVGLFDVSHMGILSVDGGRAAALLSRRTTANVERLRPGRVRYTFFLEDTGRIVDDLLISRIDTGEELVPRFVVVPNAARAAEIEEILQHHRAPDTTLRRWNRRVALLAVQGPESRKLLERAFRWDLKELGFYHLAFFPANPASTDRTGRLGPVLPSDLAHYILVSRTGYTGELGYELFVRAEAADETAEKLVSLGAVPAGLGARDTLRLEKGYLLSGQEFHRDRTPLEAGQERFVDFDHPFVGRPTLEKEKAEGAAVRLVGITVDEAGAIPRHGTPVMAEGTRVAEATSGGLAPGLGRGVALAYLPARLSAEGTAVGLEIRGRVAAGRVVPLPFVEAPSARA
jgi:glycine cleavage system T protein (aminomethyltransferase)